ncbi:protein PLASTID MOVEMENT IMPAIRED 2-like [Dorcoceras hygrometricum]|uniref:Protein PLASTID MOVEMENT IMPAIRED 2-like n=1 Tax=Dorcoceras hygrometricum TaxID=472368 RepID=A0A2Z7C8C0_9LAMI|nr:protein PLASTID MOVEMENT IMPAIRED 2-like [Dorcoceras hygrometricum]
MDGVKLDDSKTGSVKAAVSTYGGRTVKTNTTTAQKNYSKESTKTRGESGKFADEAESELFAAKRTVKDLTLRIEESNSRRKAEVRAFQKLNGIETDSSHYDRVVEELRLIKHKRDKLKLDMGSVMKEKRRAEKEKDECLSKIHSCSSLFEELVRKIEEMNEEQVLVEIAKMEAIKELIEIQDWRIKKGENFASEMEEYSRKQRDVLEVIEVAKGLEAELAIALSDITILESAVEKYKEMEKKVAQGSDLDKDEYSDLLSLLDSAKKEVKDAKETLSSIKEESFKLMTSMDIIREERKYVADEMAPAKNKEEKVNMTIQNLNSKLLRAKDQLESMSAAEETAKSIVSNLIVKLEQLKPEAEAARKELSRIRNEARTIKEEIQKTETEIVSSEENFQVLMQELEAAKVSESIALENLKELIENTLRSRASTSQRSSTITISKLEYEYLTGHAAGAKEIADKKIAASQACVEALKASEKEILIKIQLMEREARKLRMDEGREAYETEQIIKENEVIADEFENWKRNMQAKKLRPESISISSKTTNKSVRLARSVSNRGTNKSVKMAAGKRGKARGSSSPAFHGTPRSTPFVVRKRRKVLPNLAKLFSKSSEKILL